MPSWSVLGQLLVPAVCLVCLVSSAAVDGRIVTNLVSAGTGDMYRTDRVVAGMEVPEDAVLWVASIQNRDGIHFCGGTVVSAHWVLTAAHCMLERVGKPDSIQVVTGSTFLHSTKMQTRVADRIEVADYNKDEKYNDLALIHLSEPIACTGSTCEQRSYPSGMPLAESEASPGSRCWVLGWGAVTSGGSSSPKLMAARVDPMSRDQCQLDLPHYRIYNSMLCAGGDSTDACQGDSGGPLVCSTSPERDAEEDQPWSTADLQLSGAVSWGIGCASPGIPGVYADVYVLKDWIDGMVHSTSS